jgi:RHS repeat-associated protein
LDLISQERGNADSYYLVDGLGSTRGLTDGAGNVTNTYRYDAFGNLIASAGNVENDYLFAGEQFDEDLQQYYLRQRYYESETGRFTRRDTYSGHISDPITLHKYIYANANPVNGVDPSGFATITDSLSIINTISQLAARAYISVANPVVIEQARAWASILAAGIGLLGLVLTETQKDGTVGVKLFLMKGVSVIISINPE